MLFRSVTTTSAFFKTPNGSFNFQSPSGTNRWTRQAEGKTVGTGNGSFACPFPGSFDIALPNPCVVSGSTQTIGISFACPFVVTTGGGLAWHLMTFKF